MKILFLFLLVLSFSLQAEVHPSYSGIDLKEITDRVAKELHVKIDPSKELPAIVVTESFDDSTVEQDYLGLEITGSATNWYIPQRNLILLGRYMSCDHLAHELVHYIQYTYLDYTTPEDMGSDEAESTAVRIQDLFR
jgi:hypothetical protein